MKMNWRKRGIAWLLTVAMTMTSVGNNWLIGSAAENDGTAAQTESSTDSAAVDSASAQEASGQAGLSLADVFTYGEEELTWAQAGRILSGLLGFIEEDGANVDLTAYAERISSLSLDDDSFYLAILAENGYLDGVSETIDPSAVISEETYEELLAAAFATAVFTQEDAEALVSQEDPENLAMSGEDIFLNAYEAGRIVLGESGSLELSSVTAEAISVTDADIEMDLNAAEIERVLVNDGAEDAADETAGNADVDAADDTAGTADDTAADETADTADEAAADDTADAADDEDAGRLYIHIDSESGLPEVILEQADDVVIEGSGSLGVVRVMGEVDSLTVRATGSVINETDADITVTGPDHEEVTLEPGEQVEFILSGYLVSFVTDGTPVESQTVSPGSSVDFTAAQTELEGMVFTAWYTDEDYTEPYSMLNTVDEETTLYARFVDEADAVTVTFETFGGRELEPLVFAKGETLLTKDISSLYTSKEGYTFSGWCVDEDCTEAFGYSQAIEESMILYAFYVSDEIQEEEQEGTVAELVDLDWQGSIGLILPDGMTILEAMEHVSIAAGTGGEDPEISFRETDNGTEIYGTYYNEGGESGFEPGATFTVIVSDGICFDGYEEYIDTLTVSVYKEEVELVEYSEDLIWVNWEHVSDLVPVSGGTTSYVGELTADSVDTEEEVEEEVIPGSLTLDSGIQVAVGDIVAFYDGSIDDDEESILSWEGGTLDGYSMYVEITEVEESDAGTEISFINASPTEYITDLDVHITSEVNLEDSISEAQITKIEQSITTQVSQNEELSAQMQIAVMTSQKTQDMLDETYGVGVYSLASSMGSSSSIDVDTKVSFSGNKATATIYVSKDFEVSGQSGTFMTITPKLTFIEELEVNSTIDGGNLWIDAAVTLQSTSTFRFEIYAVSGGDVAVLEEARDTIDEMIDPDGVDDTVDYETNVSRMMNTMNSLINMDLDYSDLFEVTLLTAKISFKDIVTFKVDIDLLGEMKVLAVFGLEIKIISGERIGFKYNFKKLSGSSYSEKLGTNTSMDIYVVGKVGVRLGLRLTFSIIVCLVAKTSISGTLYTYAELTGLYYYTMALDSNASTSVGALYFEVGLDANVKLSLGVDFGLFTIGKSWTVWSDRWPLYSLSESSKMTYMDIEQLDIMWKNASENANKKSSYGLDYIPMKTWTLLDGSLVENELLWESTEVISLSVVAVTVNGEEITEDDPRWDIFFVGDGSDKYSLGRVYANEERAVEYKITEASCELEILLDDPKTSTLVKRQSHIFELARKFEIATTTVNVSVMLYDWCSHAWGIQAADWDGATVYTTSYETGHILGSGVEPTATGDIDLAAIEAAARSMYQDLETATLSWYDPTRNSIYGSVEYSVPKTSNFCYLTPESGTIRYDVRPGTDEYSLVFYLYARSYEGYDGTIQYIVRLIGEMEQLYGFSVNTGARTLRFSSSQTSEKEWVLNTQRTLFSGTARPLLMTMNSGLQTDTGYVITGREISDTVVFEIVLEEEETESESETESEKETESESEPETGMETEPGAEINPETELETETTPDTESEAETNRETEPEAETNPETETETEAETNPETETETETNQETETETETETEALRTNTLTFEYNYGGLGTYTSAMVAENETTAAPSDPTVEGLTFRGWYRNADCSGDTYEFGSAIEEDLTLYADWTCDVTVVFGDAAGEALYYPEGSEWPESIFENDTTEYYQFTYSTQRVGEKLLDLVEPNYSGHVLTGWYLTSDHSGEAIDLSSYTLSGGITVYAHWEQIVSVTFDWNYGAAGIYSWIMGYLGWEIGYVPEDPQREHYTFTGWYTGKACVEEQYVDVSSYMLTGDVTLYAGWTANEYKITYDLQGGENAAENPVSYTIESADITLADPAREGYTFAGWTGTDIEEALTEVVIPSGTTGRLSYTANWEPISYSITYSLLRGSLNGEIPSTYTIEDADIVLPVAEKEGYVFEGWTGTGLTEATMTVTIPAGSIGDRSYQATWSTTDPSAIIADNAIDAVEGDYTFELDDYIAGTDEASSVYQAARAALEEDAKAGLYAEEITLTLELAEADGTDNPVEDGIRYIWTFTATTAYTDDDGTVLEREGTVCAIVNKRVPTVTAPSASDLTYGAALSSSTLSGGSAAYEETDTDGNTTSVTVEGSFAWTDSAEVPKAADNGKEIYSVIFTPTDTANYAVVTVDLAVATQTGVHVYIESADSRYYIAATTRTSGTYTLTDADTGADLTSELTLSGGEFHFSQTAVETNVDVTFSGYTIADTETLPGGTVPKYGLMNAKTSETIDDATGETTVARADILQVPFGDTTNTTISMNWPAANVTYGDTLTNNLLSGGSISILYSYDYYSGSATAEGTWTWTETGLTATAAGEKICSVTFAPSDTVSYAGGAADMTVTVAKKPVDAPTLPSKVYDGEWNPSFDLPETDLYKWTSFRGGREAGDYYIRLRLKDPDNYTWSESAREAGAIDEEDETYLKVFYTVSKADFDVDVSGASVESLGYGQKLVSGTGTDIGTASRMIIGTSITFNGEPVSGGWSWDLDTLTSEQPLTVNTSGYTVDAVFIPSDTALATNVNTVRKSFTVNVLQVTPDVSNVTVTASEVFQWGWTELDASTLSADKAAVNPNDATMTVEGTWAWEVDNPETIPYVEKDKTYTAVFTPGDTTNYTAAIAKVTVPISEELTIRFTRSAIPDSDYLSVSTRTLDADNSEYVTDGNTKVIFKSKPDINKTSKVGVSVNLHNPAGDSSYKLGQYHIFSIEMTCDGTTYTHTLGNDQTLCCFADRSEITILNGLMTVSSEGSFQSGWPNLCRAIATFGFDWDQIKPTTGNITVYMVAEIYEDGASSSNSLSQAASSGLMLSAIAETEAVTEAAAEAETEAATEMQTEAAAEAQKSTEAQTEATTEAQKGTEAQTEAAAETQKSTEAQTEAATEAQKGTEAQTEAATEAQKSIEAQTEAATEAQKSAETQTEPAAETAVETQ